MKRSLTAAIMMFILQSLTFAQSSITPYYDRNDFLLTSPGALKFGLYGYDNPALLSYVRQPDILFTWSDATARWSEFKRWGLFVGVPHFGFGSVHEKTPVGHYADYRLALAAGDRTVSTGIAYGWTRADNPSLDKSSILTLSTLYRPLPVVSAGIIYTAALNTKGYELVGELAGRPWGSELVTVFADYVLHRTPQLKKDLWSAGVAVEAMPGVRITGRYFNTDAFSIGFQFSLGHAGFETQAHYDGNQKYAYNSYGIRLGAYDRNVFQTMVGEKKAFVDMDLHGNINYQKFEWFDKTQTLAHLLDMIDAAKNDPSVAGIAINTSGMEINQEVAWELREKLKDFKTTGKKVFIFIDRGGMELYHFASIADKIIMDPVGLVMLEGYSMGRTFLKGTLEKIGLGFDEWRFFKYKSAAENYSRDKMSDADREQRQKLVDDWYKIAREDISQARHMTPAQFDTLVNTKVVFLARQAKEQGLVDTLGRWELVKELVKKETGCDASLVSSQALAKFNLPYDNHWGEPPRIAVIYALGACAMDEGINARTLVKDVESAVDDSRVKAIVLRVDSPGGDAIASDYIAEALRKAKGKKPIIVSQGFVAASGGYWLSMYADTIIAAPGTITGSIGAIGGWIYNKNLKEKLGISTDIVKIGTHADLGFGMRLPLVGLTIPDRNLSVEERAEAESSIKSIYKDFVDKVALGRKMKADDVETIAQGRVWSGLDGKENGLIDVLGGLETAINIARERAGISKDQEITLIELPKKGLIDLSMFVSKSLGVETMSATDPAIELLKFRLQHNGEPLPMLPMEDIDMIRQVKEK
jgi:protease IV